MADILKRLSGVLAANIEKDLLTTAVENAQDVLASTVVFGEMDAGNRRKPARQYR